MNIRYIDVSLKEIDSAIKSGRLVRICDKLSEEIYKSEEMLHVEFLNIVMGNEERYYCWTIEKTIEEHEKRFKTF
jgi:hypothetical protein